LTARDGVCCWGVAEAGTGPRSAGGGRIATPAANRWNHGRSRRLSVCVRSPRTRRLTSRPAPSRVLAVAACDGVNPDAGGKAEVRHPMDWGAMVFQNWEGIVRTLVVGTLAYVALVLFLRISGKRTLAKLNAFDLVVTVALGSTLSAVLLQESVALAEGVTALALLIALQYGVAFASVRSRRFARIVRSEPTLLVRNGDVCDGAMKAARITRAEAQSAVRASGGRDVADVEALILESDGTLSVRLRGEA